MQILSHRANLHGPSPQSENTRHALRRAIAAGFDVEFDIQYATNDRRLVLAHDPQPWSEDRDAVSFLQSVGGTQLHALNIKSLDSLTAILRCLEDTNSQNNFLLFDFELIPDNLGACHALMRSLNDKSFSVAYRLSERETYFEQYLSDPAITHVWLDEFALPWITQAHMAQLTDRAIRTYYVSPDLHGVRDLETLKPRWEQLASWGIGSICTDFPVALRQFLNEGY